MMNIGDNKIRVNVLKLPITKTKMAFSVKTYVNLLWYVHYVSEIKVGTFCSQDKKKRRIFTYQKYSRKTWFESYFFILWTFSLFCCLSYWYKILWQMIMILRSQVSRIWSCFHRVLEAERQFPQATFLGPMFYSKRRQNLLLDMHWHCGID